jgi:release factor glutamine methyltransferase
MNIEALLKLSLIDPLEAQVLLAHALKCTRVQLVIRSKDELKPQQVTEVSALFMRRMQGEPIAYLTGEREFHGLRFEITPDVLIPRHETELLVELAPGRLLCRSRIRGAMRG